MMDTEGSVRLEEVVQALFELGGEAGSREIEDRVIENRGGGLPQQYSYWKSYRLTINQMIQFHCPGYRKYRGSAHFEKVNPGRFRLASGAIRLIDAPTTLRRLNRGDTEKESKTRSIAPETFKAIQQEATRIGEKGEQIVFESEVRELQKAGRQDLADRVRRVSLENVAAGYDIRSFSEDGNEKLIEVKSSKSSSPSFELTANELRTARKHGPSYWIYRVYNVDNYLGEIKKLQDLAAMIDQGILTIEATSFSVTIESKT